VPCCSDDRGRGSQMRRKRMRWIFIDVNILRGGKPAIAERRKYIEDVSVEFSERINKQFQNDCGRLSPGTPIETLQALEAPGLAPCPDFPTEPADPRRIGVRPY